MLSVDLKKKVGKVGGCTPPHITPGCLVTFVRTDTYVLEINLNCIGMYQANVSCVH